MKGQGRAPTRAQFAEALTGLDRDGLVVVSIAMDVVGSLRDRAGIDSALLSETAVRRPDLLDRAMRTCGVVQIDQWKRGAS